MKRQAKADVESESLPKKARLDWTNEAGSILNSAKNVTECKKFKSELMALVQQTDLKIRAFEKAARVVIHKRLEAAQAAGRSYKGKNALQCAGHDGATCTHTFDPDSSYGSKCDTCQKLMCDACCHVHCVACAKAVLDCEDDALVRCECCSEPHCDECISHCPGGECGIPLCVSCGTSCDGYCGSTCCDNCLNEPECGGCNRRAGDEMYCEDCQTHFCK